MLSTTSSQRISRRQAGQGMTEYIIIVILVAVAAIGVYMYFGQVVRSDVAGMAQEMAGQTSTTTKDAKTAADAAKGETAQKTLGTYESKQTK
jgi:hypothetical protein